MHKIFIDTQPRFFDARFLAEDNLSSPDLVEKFLLKPSFKIDKLEFQKRVIIGLPDCKTYDPYHMKWNMDKLLPFYQGFKNAPWKQNLRRILMEESQLENQEHRVRYSDLLNVIEKDNLNATLQIIVEGKLKSMFSAKKEDFNLAPVAKKVKKATRRLQQTIRLTKREQRICIDMLLRLDETQQSEEFLNLTHPRYNIVGELKKAYKDAFIWLWTWFKQNQGTQMSSREIFSAVQSLNPYFEAYSFSTFYSKFIANKLFMFRKVKYTHIPFNQQKKEDCRPITNAVIYKVLESNQQLYFYDESTFLMHFNHDKGWFQVGERPERRIKNFSDSVALNIICSINKLVSFGLTTRILNSQELFLFLKSSGELIKQDLQADVPVYLLLDNSPKNRSKNVNKLASENQIRLIYTTPTTPQQNFCECVFRIVKLLLRKEVFYNR